MWNQRSAVRLMSGTLVFFISVACLAGSIADIEMSTLPMSEWSALTVSVVLHYHSTQQSSTQCSSILRLIPSNMDGLKLSESIRSDLTDTWLLVNHHSLVKDIEWREFLTTLHVSNDNNTFLLRKFRDHTVLGMMLWFVMREFPTITAIIFLLGFELKLLPHGIIDIIPTFSTIELSLVPLIPQILALRVVWTTLFPSCPAIVCLASLTLLLEIPQNWVVQWSNSSCRPARRSVGPLYLFLGSLSIGLQFSRLCTMRQVQTLLLAHLLWCSIQCVDSIVLWIVSILRLNRESSLLDAMVTMSPTNEVRTARKHNWLLSPSTQYLDSYPIGMFENIEFIKQFRCGICKEVAFPPITTACSHLFCHSCLRVALLYSSKCPIDRYELDLSPSDLHPNAFLYRILQDETAYCVLEHRGCRWKGRVKDVVDHLQSNCCARGRNTIPGVLSHYSTWIYDDHAEQSYCSDDDPDHVER